MISTCPRRAGLISAAILTSLLPIAAAGAQDEAALKSAAMEKVAFLVGEWEGEGWLQMGEQRGEFRGTETVTSMLGGRVLIVEGKHLEAESGQPVHHAVAVITYDTQAGHYWFRSEVAGRGGTDATARMEGDAFVWTMNTAWGAMRYTIRLDERGVWHEIGEISRDGVRWTQHFEMTMRRREAS